MKIDELLQRAFRRRSERFLANPEQMLLDFGETPAVTDAAAGVADAKEELSHVLGYTRRRRVPRPARNEPLPAHLPRRELAVPVAAEVSTCPTHGARRLLGYDVSETLMFERPQLWVAVRKYPKYVCAGAPACGVQEPAQLFGGPSSWPVAAPRPRMQDVRYIMYWQTPPMKKRGVEMADAIAS